MYIYIHTYVIICVCVQCVCLHIANARDKIPSCFADIPLYKKQKQYPKIQG